MDDEATQQSTQDQEHYAMLEPSIGGPGEDDALGVLVGSLGMQVRWPLVPSAGENGRVWSFGRGATNTFQLDPDRKRLSNTHFRIFATNDTPPTLMLTDCSTNGTFLNNVRMTKGKNCMIVNGDVISVGVGVPQDELKFIVSVPKKDSRPRPTSGVHAMYDFHDILGQGAFASVRLAVVRDTGEKVAVKIIPKSKVNVNTAVQREIEVLRAVQNPYIVCLRDLYEDNNQYYLVMDYVPGGDLMDFVQSAGFIEEDPGREILRQVLVGIRHVHRMGISHRDLKPDNILIAQDHPVQIKIADFGLAKISNQGTFLKTFCGTLSYLAPEVLASRNAGKTTAAGYSQLVDIWSVGCVAYVILTGYMPFNGATQDELFKSVQSGRYNMEPLKASGISEGALDFIRYLLTVDVSKRPTAAQALRHPWILMGAENSDPGQESVEVPSLPGASAPSVPVDNGLRGISALNIQSSQVRMALDSSIGGEFDEGVNDDEANELIPSAPSLAHHEDSELDSSEAKLHADFIAASQIDSAAGLASATGVRDLDDLVSMVAADPVPQGSWIKLATQPDSVPFKDIYISADRFMIGRESIEQVDFQIKDPRISKLHCRLTRVRNSAGKYEVWLQDFSTNGVFVNGVSSTKNHQVQLYDGDALWLYLYQNPENPGDGVVLGFDVVFLDKRAYSAHRTAEPRFVATANADIPLLPAHLASQPSVLVRKRSRRELSVDHKKRRAAAV